MHNLRATLDLLIWQLVTINGGIPGRQNQFPIFDQAVDFDRGFRAPIRGVSSHAVEVIRDLKAFETGNYPLWLLHRLDIIDKHRVLLPAYSSVGTTILDFAAPLRAEFGLDIPPAELGLNWADPACPLRDGDELWRLRADLLANAPSNPKFQFTIAFGDGVPVKKGRPIVEILTELSGEVARVVALFPELSTPPQAEQPAR